MLPGRTTVRRAPRAAGVGGSSLAAIGAARTDRGQVEPKPLKPISLLNAFNQEKVLFKFFLFFSAFCSRVFASKGVVL